MKNSSLEVKIYAGFAVIMGLLLLSGIVSSLGLSHLSASRQATRDVETANARALLIDRDVQELRMRVDRYVASGSEQQLEAINDIHDRVTEELAVASREITDPELLAVFDRIGLHVEQYASHIPTIEAERDLRRTLVQVELPRQADRIEAAFSAMANRSGANYADALALARCKTFFLQAERSLSRYFDDPDTGIVNTVVEYLGLARSLAATLSISKEARIQLTQAIEAFERTALRAVQTTRSYLFFLNVVMAGEASEVAHYSTVLREMAAQRRITISERSLATSLNTTRMTGTIMAVALGLTLLIAARLAYLTVSPIKKLTQLFEKLAAGAVNVDIHGTDRGDEIGRMARAAQSFSERNRRTEELLAESECLRTELERNAARLEASNKELDDFAYVASHDLKSPLRSIRQLATWVGEDAADVLPPESAGHLDLLVARISKMDGLLEDLLSYSRAGRVESTPEPMPVSQLLESIVELTDNPDNVQIVFEPDLPTICVVGPPLEQVLRNMIGNSVKHCDKGSKGRVEITFSADGPWCRFRVADNGPGIDPADHERAFQMYQRVGSAKVEGSGMGLAIIKKQVETRGGEITLESQPGEGAVFEFTWPIESVDYGELQRKAS